MMAQLKRLLTRQGISEFWAFYRSVTIALCSASAMGSRNGIAELVTAELEGNPHATSEL